MSEKYDLPEGFVDLCEEVKMPMMMKKEEESSDESSEEKEYYYPSLYFRNKTALKDLPKEGTAIIHFKKLMEREEKVTTDGKTSVNYTTELEIHGIKPDKDSEYSTPSTEEPDDDDAIEKGLEAASQSSTDKD
jgi:hypothetical protein